ncbi:MAG: hypothetical protein ABFC62_02560 [Clostridiaceae bacterium]|nr:hypothetical protein [Eubacteriales bacterium]
MKRFFASILAVLFLLAGCAAGGARRTPSATPVFTFGGTHKAVKAYSQAFSFNTASNEACTLNIETRVFSEERAARLWEIVTGDLGAIAARIPLKQVVPEVYVVQKTLHGMAERIGYFVYCTPEDVENGAYREMLISVALGFDPYKCWWKTKGLIAYAFGETMDEAALHAYYGRADEERMQVLSLFPAYFTEGFASGQELSVARATARSLTAYILGKYGTEAFFQEGDRDYRQEWLKELGVDRVYTDPYAEAFAGYSYSSSASYPLVVTTAGRHVFRMLPLPGDIDTPKAVRDFLYWSAEGMRGVLAGIKAFAPEYYNDISHNYGSPIYYYFKRGGGLSCAYPDERKVELTRSFAFLHETVDILIPSRFLDEPNRWSWRHEAIAEYLPYTFAADALQREGDPGVDLCYKTLFDEVVAETEEYAQYRAMLRAAYFSYAGEPREHEEIGAGSFRVGAYYKALGETAARHPQYARYGLIRQTAEDLSYEEAYAFADYLIGKYSLSAFLRYCSEGDKVTFEEVFGTGYQQAKAEWIEGIPW